MSRKTVAPVFLPVFALIAGVLGLAAEFGWTDGQENGWRRTSSPAADAFLPDASESTARLTECALQDADDQTRPSDTPQPRRGRWLPSSTTEPGYIPAGSINRSPYRAAIFEHSPYPLDIRFPVALNREYCIHATPPSLAVIMPNPRSPPATPVALPRTATL